MKTFTEASDAYLSAVRELGEHQNSEMGEDIRTKRHLDRYSAYSVLAYWAESPLLEGMGEAERKELVRWGDGYREKLTEFHARTAELESARHRALCEALTVLGYETGKAFHEASGAFDERIHGILGKADERRRYELDGIGYVSVREEDGYFEKGFYKSSGLKKSALFSDLTLCAVYRAQHQIGQLKATKEELERLNLALGERHECH